MEITGTTFHDLSVSVGVRRGLIKGAEEGEVTDTVADAADLSHTLSLSARCISLFILYVLKRGPHMLTEAGRVFRWIS